LYGKNNTFPQLCVFFKWDVTASVTVECTHFSLFSFTECMHIQFFAASSARLLMAPSEEAKRFVSVRSERAKPKEEVLAEARTFVTGHGGDQTDDFLVLAHCQLQFGMYQGQRFRWLLEHCLSYALYLVDSVSKESAQANPLSQNKQMTEELEKFRKKRDMQATARETGGCLMVEFGEFQGRSMKEVYEDQSKEAQALIKYLVRADARPNTNMALFKAYVLKRRTSASTSSAPGIQTGPWKTANVKALLARGKHLSPSQLAKKLTSPVKPCE